MLFPHSSEVLYSSFSAPFDFSPHFEFHGFACMKCVYFLTSPAALLFHLGLHVDKWELFFVLELTGLFAMELSLWWVV